MLFSLIESTLTRYLSSSSTTAFCPCGVGGYYVASNLELVLLAETDCAVGRDREESAKRPNTRWRLWGVVGGSRTCGFEAVTWEKSLVWWGCVERQPLLPGGGWLTRFVIFAREKTLSTFRFAWNSGWDTRHALNIGRLIYERKINNNLFKLELIYTRLNIILGCYSSNMFSALRGIGFW